MEYPKRIHDTSGQLHSRFVSESGVWRKMRTFVYVVVAPVKASHHCRTWAGNVGVGSSSKDGNFRLWREETHRHDNQPVPLGMGAHFWLCAKYTCMYECGAQGTKEVGGSRRGEGRERGRGRGRGRPFAKVVWNRQSLRNLISPSLPALLCRKEGIFGSAQWALRSITWERSSCWYDHFRVGISNRVIYQVRERLICTVSAKQ